MRCRIADLITTVPSAGGLASRCAAYLCENSAQAQIVISEESYHPEYYPADWTEDMVAYMESGAQFYRELVKHNGFFLHASAVVLDGKAYLFSAHSGVGKSTHARLWQQLWPQTRIINDDKPALRYIDGRWIAYGTPWCGKDGINLNESAPLAGICYLKQGTKNEIRRLPKQEAMQRILGQTIRRFQYVQNLDRLLTLLEQLLEQIPVYELENLPEPDAARLSYETMRRGAEEAGL